jgi:hypothetical protein
MSCKVVFAMLASDLFLSRFPLAFYLVSVWFILHLSVCTILTLAFLRFSCLRRYLNDMPAVTIMSNGGRCVDLTLFQYVKSHDTVTYE